MIGLSRMFPILKEGAVGSFLAIKSVPRQRYEDKLGLWTWTNLKPNAG